MRERADSNECSLVMRYENRAGSVREGLGKLAPGHEFYVFLAQDRFELRAGEEIEIALTPGGAPGVALASSGAHFVIGKRQVNNEHGDSWLEVVERVGVKVAPFVGGNTGADRDGMIYDEIGGSQRGLEIWVVLEPIADHDKWKFVIVGDVEKSPG